MSLYSPRASGLGNSAAYQVSGRPYLTGSLTAAIGSGQTLGQRTEYTVEFPTVTKRVKMQNFTPSTDYVVYFSPKSESPSVLTGNHIMLLPCNSGSIDLDIKCTKLYLTPAAGGTTQNPADTTAVNQGAFLVQAELTGIPASDMYELTGSGINVSVYGNGVS